MKLYWSGDVGWISNDGSGITVESVKNALDELGGAPLEVELTTMGGDFFQAAPIMSLIRNYRGMKTAWLNGIVASAGTVIALGFDKIVARPTSMFMIHNAQSLAFGDHNDMRAAADLYERMSNTIAEEYAAKTGQTVAEIKALMDAETWFMGQEIVDAGFADQMETDVQQKASAMMLISAQAAFKERVTMWAKRKPDAELADKSMRSSMANAESLIKSGNVDTTSPWKFTTADQDALLGPNGDDWATYKLWHVVQDDAIAQKTKERYKYPYGKAGKVYRSALRAIASRAAAQGLTDVSDWASAQIKVIDAKGASNVNKEQVLAWLKDNPGVPISELAAALGQVQMIASPAHVAALELVTKLAAEKIADPIAEITSLRASLAAVETDRIANTLTATFGAEKLETGVVNNLRSYANTMLKGVKLDVLPAAIEAFKKDPIALKLAGERMDVNSEQNAFGKLDGKPVEGEKKTVGMYAGAPLVEV